MLPQDYFWYFIFSQDRLSAMERENEINLHSRRRELADLYNAEMDQWKAEVLANVETQEDRKLRYSPLKYLILYFEQNHGACLRSS